MILAAVPFHTGTSIFSWVPSGPETVISFKNHPFSRADRTGVMRERTFVFDVMASMEHMKISATMKTATKLQRNDEDCYEATKKR